MTIKDQSIEQKVVFITGANSGMGLETALLFAKKQFRVYGSVRSSDKAKMLKELAQNEHVSITPVICDVTNPNDVNEAVNFIIEDAGSIDILINNAGYGLVASVEEGTDEEFIQQFNVNVFGVLRMCRAVIPSMRKKRSGMIINISSFLGKMGLPLLTHYCSSKYAVEGITDSLRHELMPFGIKVHTIAPGLFKTGFVTHGLKANTDTTNKNSAYSDHAQILLPQIIDMIDSGPSPKIVANIVLSTVENENSNARITAGDDSAYFDKIGRELNHEQFEFTVKELLSL
ncbi:SDR family oxidoreductase [Photobacterium ganghwense]|uniref:SDR family oxidoreductase n=1 Tax=Photobacterium ganghwense TaxID=320778 RepID=UPI004056AF4F